MDFSEKSYIDPAQIAQLAQNQAAKQAQIDQQAVKAKKSDDTISRSECDGFCFYSHPSV